MSKHFSANSMPTTYSVEECFFSFLPCMSACCRWSLSCTCSAVRVINSSIYLHSRHQNLQCGILRPNVPARPKDTYIHRCSIISTAICCSLDLCHFVSRKPQDTQNVALVIRLEHCLLIEASCCCCYCHFYILC